MSEQTLMVAPPPAAGAGAVEVAELAAVLALATALVEADWLVATDGLAAEFVGSSTAVAVAGSTVVGVVAAFDFVAGLHAAYDNPTTPTASVAAAVDSTLTCMAAPCSDDSATDFAPHRS